MALDSLNEDGYVDTVLSIWRGQCHTTMDQVTEALIIIQALEPAGIGVRTLGECINL